MRGLQRRIADSPLGGSPAVLAGIVVWNAGNYAFFLLAGRVIGPDDYGVVAALLAATLIVLVPSGALQIGISRRLAAINEDGQKGADALVRQAVRWAGGAGLAAASVGIVATLLVVPSVGKGAILLTGCAILPMGILSVGLGALQGRQRFGAFAGVLAMLGALRPIAFALLAVPASGVIAAMGATALAIAAAATVAIVLTWPRRPSTARLAPSEWADFRRGITPLAVGLSGIAVLLNVDIIVAKMSQPDQTAGYFGAVAVLAKAVTVVPQAVSWVLLPGVARLNSTASPTGPLLAIGVVVTIGAGVVASLAGLVFGDQIVELAFGSEYVDGASLLAPLLAVSSLVGLLMLLMTYHAALGRDLFIWTIAVLAVAEIMLFLLFHTSAASIIWVEAVVGLTGVAVHEFLFGRGDDGLCRNLALMLNHMRAQH